ncbi:prolyl hydroxylase family protein [Sphingomonas sp. CFBP 13720]|uniref:prolyl hydroxylase family protein n=1 Tax=Sphingomonas sp. CFBP 13720 TaxID=2775302 RepID=UPI00178640A1|nr:2OG-Fe(II) oxygenase [Sphingomonas sp. CFBP 13720]MBD8678850.1 2OG-Fe(II) oxygenase [Sphingomonas sp. CFBP 13720]
MATTLRKPPGTPSPVRADYGRSVAARLAATPGIRRAKTDSVTMFALPDFLSAEDCALLIATIDHGRRKSTLLSSTNDPNFRTSDSCDLDRWHPLLQPIDEKIAHALGIAPEHGETMQGQRYAGGQQFRAHHDYFNENEPYWASMAVQGGQRTWTAMVYLNDVEQGGATWFPQAGVRFNPRPGMLVAWDNMMADGSPNLATLHEGMAVVEGTKYIITKWFRERPWTPTIEP